MSWLKVLPKHCRWGYFKVPTESRKAEFYLFHTLGCHLCDEAQTLLEPMFSHFQLSWEKVDIADPVKDSGLEAESLVEQWGLKIPVLYCTFNHASLSWPFDEEAVLQFWQQVFNEDH